MKGFAKFWAIAVVALILAGVYFAGGLGGLWSIPAGTCQDIYAYYPSFRCCDEVEGSSGTYSITNTGWWQCPTYATSCDVTPMTMDNVLNIGWYKGSTNCAGGWFGQFWCEDATPMTLGATYSLGPGEYAFHNSFNLHTLSYQNYELKLCECSLSPCGEPCPAVLGSSGCSFVTDEVVYDDDGNLKVDSVYVPGMGVAYTVPTGSCYTFYPDSNRHPIGNTCEECSSTAECASSYPSTYTYFGVTYGAVCDGSYVQLYDCMPTGGDICIEWRENADGQQVECLETGTQTRCDLYLSIPVQCCPGTSSCGVQSFCNPDTYTCETTAECSYDYECGSTVQCDYTSKVLKTPKCISGTCTFQELAVDCCYDSNCADGYFCDTDYKCKEKPTQKIECPHECCSGEQYYFDKPCPSGEPVCCGDHNCAARVEECSYPPGTGDQDAMNAIWIIVFTALFGAIGYYKKEWIGAVIGGIAGFIVGMAVFWLLSIAWWQLLGLGLLGAGIAIIFGYLIVLAIPFIIAIMIALK